MKIQENKLSNPERERSPEENAILDYLNQNEKASTKEIADNVKEIPKNRAIAENYLIKLFAQDDILMTREGRARVWRPNHITVNLRKKPLAWAVLPQDSEYGRRKLWFDLHPSPKGGQYVYVQESRFVDGEGWMNKGGIVIPLDILTDFVANLFKIALKSVEFKERYPQVAQEQKKFLNEISSYAGVKVPNDSEP